MKTTIQNAIKNFVLHSEHNWSDTINDYWFDEPIVQFAAADDPLFAQYKEIIGSYHLTPREITELTFGPDSYHGGTVISVVLPINDRIRKGNAQQKEWPAKEWALLRTYQGEFFKKLTDYIVDFLKEQGYKAVAPYHSKWFKQVKDASGPSSNWSERHIAYAAGLGTFSLNDAFITDKGIAVKLVSVVTNLILEPDVRKAESHLENCLFFSSGKCGACIKRCPVGAISEKGHDKIKCFQYAYGEDAQKLAASYGGNPAVGAGCGLCQTNVPCEGKNPTRLKTNG